MNGQGYTSYAYVSRVNGERMEFVSPEEAHEYAQTDEESEVAE